MKKDLKAEVKVALEINSFKDNLKHDEKFKEQAI